MKHYRIISAIVATLLAITAIAQQASLTFHDNRLHCDVTFTAVTDDIVRVDVVPEGWDATRLPTLASDKALNGRVPKVKITEDGNLSSLVTENGLSVTKIMNLIIVGHGDTYYLFDRIPGRDSAKVVLAHEPGESFYGAGERGYSFNLAGDTLINYNTQNYGYQMGEKRTKLMGITMPFVISSKGYGVLFDDFCNRRSSWATRN